MNEYLFVCQILFKFYFIYFFLETAKNVNEFCVKYKTY